LSGAATGWALWMLPALWQVTLLALGVLILDLLLRRVVWPQLLHALWMLVPLGLFVPAGAEPLAGGATVAAPAAPPGGWLVAGASGVAVFGALALLAGRRALRGAPMRDPVLDRAAARLGLRRRVALVCSARIASPAVAGLFRPRIGMPDEPMSEQEREHVYLHELAHVQRGDLWAAALFGIVHLVFWFHPLVHVARRRAHALRELGCDARVASVLKEQTPAYRDTLLRFAARLLPAPGAAAFVGGPATILLRLRRLERGEWVRTGPRRLAAAIVLVALLVTAAPLAQARVVDPALAALHAERARVADRALHLYRNYESEGCIELQWAVQRLIQMEKQAKESK